MRNLQITIVALALSGFCAMGAPDAKDHKGTKECNACCESAKQCDACCHDKGKGEECKTCCFDQKKKK